MPLKKIACDFWGIEDVTGWNLYDENGEKQEAPQFAQKHERTVDYFVQQNANKEPRWKELATPDGQPKIATFYLGKDKYKDNKQFETWYNEF